MAPLPSNNTDQYFLDYTTSGEQHTLLCRAADGSTAAGASAAIDALLDVIQGNFNLITVDLFRFQAAGTNISLPVTWAGSATYGGPAGDHFETAQYLDFVGRSSEGRRCRVAVFGATFSFIGNDYRVGPSEGTLVADALAVLSGSPGYFVAIDGLEVVWNNYANCGVNAYWRNKVR